MGVETSEHIDLTCDICKRKFAKIQALNRHRRYVHKIKAIVSKVNRPLKKRVKVEPVKLLRKKVIKPKLAKRKSLAMSPPKLRTNVASRIVNEVSVEKNDTPVRKTVFKCPKCVKIFNVYFSAYKHIQKNHCVDASGKPVEPNSSQLIKPVRVEPCKICQKPKIESHICIDGTEVSTNEDEKNRCMCLGCQKTFDNLELFEDHITEIHANNVESLFFTSNNEYTSWKTELESTTKTKFASRHSDTKTKQPYDIYHCAHQPTLEMNKILLCPSFLRVTEFKNGCQVFYYKEHFGHSCSEFASNKYRKYSITSYLKDFDIKTLNTDINIYNQFTVIMNNITNNVTNIDSSLLNTLLNKALEMAVFINIASQDAEQTVVAKNMTDDQITEVLAQPKTYPSRRKPDSINKPVKKAIQENNENVKGNSPNIPVSTAESLPATKLNRTLLQSPPSFNDTYRDFVDQTISKQIMETPSSTPKTSNSVKKKTVMKTKIGQFKPSLSPKEIATVQLPKTSPKRKQLSPQNVIPPKKPKPVVLTKTSGKAAISPQMTKTSSKISVSPQTTKVSKKAASPQTVKSPLTSKQTHKQTLLSPKRTKPKPLKSTDFKIKAEIKYEVKEQENDCNILILKI